MKQIVSYLTVDEYENLYLTGNRVMQSRIEKHPIYSAWRNTTTSKNILEMETEVYAGITFFGERRKQLCSRYPASLTKLKVYSEEVSLNIGLSHTKIRTLDFDSSGHHGCISNMIGFPPNLSDLIFSYQMLSYQMESSKNASGTPTFPKTLVRLRLCNEGFIAPQNQHAQCCIDLSYLVNLKYYAGFHTNVTILPQSVEEATCAHRITSRSFSNMKMLRTSVAQDGDFSKLDELWWGDAEYHQMPSKDCKIIIDWKGNAPVTYFHRGHFVIYDYTCKSYFIHTTSVCFTADLTKFTAEDHPFRCLKYMANLEKLQAMSKLSEEYERGGGIVIDDKNFPTNKLEEVKCKGMLSIITHVPRSFDYIECGAILILRDINSDEDYVPKIKHLVLFDELLDGNPIFHEQSQYEFDRGYVLDGADYIEFRTKKSLAAGYAETLEGSRIGYTITFTDCEGSISHKPL